jgi:hypothetical protein
MIIHGLQPDSDFLGHAAILQAPAFPSALTRLRSDCRTKS